MALQVAVRSASPIRVDVAFRVEAGELMALVGPSGAGKSTVLRVIAGLHRPESGQVAVAGSTWLDTAGGVDMPVHRRKVGVVFQSYALFPQMSALANVMAAGASAVEARRLLALVRLDGLETRRPTALSGGQQQRVAVARALARQPDVLLLDEPFSAVDRATREDLYQEIATLRSHLDMPVILVTHDLDEARRLADRIVVMDQGAVLRAGPVDEVLIDPAVLRGMGLREAGSTLGAHIAAQETDGLTRLEAATGPIWLPRIDGEIGAAVRVRIMAHDVIVSRDAPDGISALNTLPCVVDSITPGEGPGAMVRLCVGKEILLARITRRSVDALGLKPGETCHAVLKSMAVARSNVRPR